jgi:hypothetical protein
VSDRTLTDADVTAIADAVVERMAGRASTPELVDVATIARRFGLSTAYVYDHAAELGAVRIGGGTRPRLRFDPSVVAERIGTPCSASSTSQSRKPASRAKPRRTGAAKGQNGPRVLPIGDPEAGR